MPIDPTITAPGTTGISEAPIEWLRFKNVDEFNAQFIGEIARGMLSRAKAHNMSDAEILGAADAKELRYRHNFAQFWKARGLEVDKRAADTAWQKTRVKAVQEYQRLRAEAMRAAAPPLPKADVRPGTELQQEQELVEVGPPPPPKTQEKPLAILDAAKWFRWNDVVFTPEKYHELAAEFVPQLGAALGEMSTNTETRSFQLETVKNLFMQILFRMYCNQYTERSPEELRDNVQGWLDENWKRVLAAAQRFR